MHKVTTVELARDCEAVQIPVGTMVTLSKGTAVDITQTLGGTYTVHVQGGLYRISGKDADALGIEAAPAQEEKEARQAGGSCASVDEKLVWETLRTCFDPEIPVNVVDLGLVYDLQIEKVPGGANRVTVKMTLTAPGCGMGATIAGDAQQKLLSLEGVEEADVELVWDPPWHPSMISAQGKRILGLE
ncbi:MAG: putative Fe-S cluster assembly protein SufT [Verrucomicrobia bacterium]|nr:MAG: putative Fe-S cluster assembly protein SufT [Verrucomicrobiota bacterium]